MYIDSLVILPGKIKIFKGACMKENSNINDRMAGYPCFYNPNQKFHGLFHCYSAIIYKTVQNKLKKTRLLLSFRNSLLHTWLENVINMQVLLWKISFLRITTLEA